MSDGERTNWLLFPFVILLSPLFVVFWIVAWVHGMICNVVDRTR